MAVFVIWLQPTASMSAFSGVKVNRVNALLLRQQRVQHRWLIGLVLLLLVVFVANLLVGPVALSRLLAGDALSPLQQQVLLQLRLPRACLAMLLGAGLAMSGCVLQTLLQNPLAEPGLIGVSSGASLAAVMMLFLAQRLGLILPPWGLSIAAFGGALLVTSTLLFLARGGRLDNVRLLLLGVAIGICSSAITTWLLYFANDQSLREMMFWMMGSLAYGQSQPLWWWLPYLAVMMPTGNSPLGSRLRDNRSANNSATAPASMEANSTKRALPRPRSRIRWGISSPMKPIEPASATANPLRTQTANTSCQRMRRRSSPINWA